MAPTAEIDGKFSFFSMLNLLSLCKEMTQRKNKERLIPKQNKTLIAGICSCQLTVVLSLVAFMYLSVAIYMPSFRAFKSGFETTPVTCQTIETVMINNCSWASCGEWCLTKTTGFCPQIHVTVRRNGTDMILENCSRLSKSSCPPVLYFTKNCSKARPDLLHKHNCNNGTECSTLTGLFNCSLGHCANMSEIYQCDYKTDTVTIDSEKDNSKLSGFFECKHSRCTKVKKYITCDRFCQKITTSGMNAYIVHENDVYSMDCQRMVAASEPATEIWSEEKKGKVLFASCTKVDVVSKIDNFTLRGTDCINGTMLPESDIPTPFINHTIFWKIYERAVEPVDPEDKFLPSQKSLTIYNTSRLYINLDGCVNTLKGECKEFLATHGKDGRNRTAYSRFPCFYNKENSAKAIARYDLDKTRRELIIALSIPSILFVVSFTTLIIITRSVKVGDDTVLRCQLCGSSQNAEEENSNRNKDELTDVEAEAETENYLEKKSSKAKRNRTPKCSDNNGGAMVL